MSVNAPDHTPQPAASIAAIALLILCLVAGLSILPPLPPPPARPSWRLVYEDGAEIHFAAVLLRSGTHVEAVLHSSFQEPLTNEAHNLVSIAFDCARPAFRILSLRQTDRQGWPLRLIPDPDPVWRPGTPDHNPVLARILQTICTPDRLQQQPVTDEPRLLAQAMLASRTPPTTPPPRPNAAFNPDEPDSRTILSA